MHGPPIPAAAVAVRDGRVFAVGPERAIREIAGRETQVVELDGRLLLPGFIDAHVHFLTGGFQLGQVDLLGADRPDELATRIARHASGLPAGSWITGSGWDHQRWGGTLPERSWIDAAAPDHPVFVTRLDLHMGVANTEALSRAGIDRNSVAPEGGAIERDARGEPTGLLRDRAMAAVLRAIPTPSAEEEDAALRAALSHAARLGLTGVHDMGSWDHLEAYRRARSAGDLTLRITAYLPIATWEKVADEVGRRGAGDEWLRWAGVKGFVDGSLGSKTALFSQPYEGEPHNRGLRVTDPSDLAHWVRAADEAGLQVAVHAIGDEANHELLDLFEAVSGETGPRDRRFRIEHAQHLHPADTARFAVLGVVPSVQPYHAIDDGRWAESVIGVGRAERMHVFRTIADSGARLAFGSDWTVAPLDPLSGIDAAVTRRTLDGRNRDGWFPAERVSLTVALRAYTSGAAFAGFGEDAIGTIEPGKRADLVALSDDLFTNGPERIAGARVEITMIDGKVVFTA